jgi:hypothetical protein
MNQDFECPRCGHCCHVEEEHMTDREAMQMALEALEEINKLSIGGNAICLPAEIDGAMDALRQALETKRQWVGLTADEIWKCNRAKSGSAVEFHICYAHQNVEDFAEAIEAKLREKNT